MVTVRLGVGLVVLFGALVGARLEATLRKGGGWGWASSHFGKAVKGVTTEAVGRGPGRGVGWLPKLVLSKLPELDMAAGLHYLSLFSTCFFLVATHLLVKDLGRNSAQDLKCGFQDLDIGTFNFHVFMPFLVI